jgi:hypothetical protein
MQVVGPSYTAKPYARPSRPGHLGIVLWHVAMRGGGPVGRGITLERAYVRWRKNVQRQHDARFDHKLYFPGDPEWKCASRP